MLAGRKDRLNVSGRLEIRWPGTLVLARCDHCCNESTAVLLAEGLTDTLK